MRRAAVGCRTHSGWAALVVMAEGPRFPEVLYRRRIEICDGSMRGSKQPYHTDEPLPFPEATALLKTCAASTRQLARKALRALVDELSENRLQAVGFGLILGSGRPLPAVETILSSHALIHTAEGEFYRDAMADAGKYCGLKFLGVKEREVFDRGAGATHLACDELRRRVTEMGKTIGPPWTQDQKLAAVAGWMALLQAITPR